MIWKITVALLCSAQMSSGLVDIEPTLESVSCNPKTNFLLQSIANASTNPIYSHWKAILSNEDGRLEEKSCYKPWVQPPFMSMAICNADSTSCECQNGAELDANGICVPKITTLWGCVCKPDRWSLYFEKTIGPFVELLPRLKTPQAIYNAVFYFLYSTPMSIAATDGVPSDAIDSCYNKNHFLECASYDAGLWRCDKCFSKAPLFRYHTKNCTACNNAAEEHRCIAQNNTICFLRINNLGETLNQNATYINTTCTGGLPCKPIANLDFHQKLDIWTCGGYPWKFTNARSAAFTLIVRMNLFCYLLTCAAAVGYLWVHQ